MSNIEDVVIRGDMIRLGQLLKYVGLAESGSHAAAMIADGDIEVNDEPELRRGRQLVDGDSVTWHGPEGTQVWRIVSP